MGTMVAGVAHEVNNPLAVLKSNARYLAEVLPEGLSAMSPEDRLDTTVAVQEIETCTLRIQRIVESLRRLVRTPQAAAACELEPALEEARLVCRARLPEHLSMRFDVLPQPPKVAVSQDDLVLIVSNLVINAGHAIEASKGQGHVDVRVREAQGRLSLEIEDNGCGIPAQLLSQVCNPFFTTKPPGKGTGLGLSLVHQVVKNAGGEMKIDSVDGAGTCVRIALPVAR
jgi:C4-dicarboxylate-specific signal transduction histidine kinase